MWKRCAPSCPSAASSSTACAWKRTASSIVRRGSDSRRLREPCRKTYACPGCVDPLGRQKRMRSTRPRSQPATKALMAKSLDRALRGRQSWRELAQDQERRTRSISWCSLRSGAMAGAPASSRICIWARSITATGEYVMLGKTFKGLTDAMLEWQTKEFLARETHRDKYTVLRAARARRRDRVQRSAGEPALSRRACVTARAREAISRRQARRGCGHHGVRARDRGRRRLSARAISSSR